MWYTVQFVGHRLTHSPLLPLSLLYVPVAYRLTAPDSRFRTYANLPLGLALLHTAATVWALVFLHYWAVAIEPAFRVQNLINMVLLLGWFFSLTVLVRVFRPTIERWQLMSLKPIWVVIVAAGLLLTTWRNDVVRLITSDLLSGRAKQYSDAMDSRYVRLAQPGADTVALAPLPATPASLVVEDIRPQPNHLWNRCWSGYFHQKAIVLKP